jgi:alpha-ketoglutaric semialdehyde dehydrogenase
VNITGDMLIGATAVHGSETEFRATNPATGEALQPGFSA